MLTNLYSQMGRDLLLLDEFNLIVGQFKLSDVIQISSVYFSNRYSLRQLRNIGIVL